MTRRLLSFVVALRDNFTNLGSFAGSAGGT
jgi:hypothetical protein